MNNPYLTDDFFRVDDETKEYFDDNHEFTSKKYAFTGLEIQGQVRTLSPVLFYQTNIRYLIMSNNQLKSLPAGKSLRNNSKSIHFSFFLFLQKLEI